MNTHIICENCGGESYSINRNGVAVCDFCRSPIPQASTYSEEVKEIISARQIKDFAKADVLCNELLSNNQSLSAAWWQKFLIKYGICNVKDTDGSLKSTFCNYHYEPNVDLLKDEYLKKAMDFAQSPSDRAIYKQQAEYIQNVLNNYIKLMEADKNVYDIFISFKSHEDELVMGKKKRTDDYANAETIYNFLKDECGYKVFWSPVEIEYNTEMAGEEYESRIYKALQTSQALVLLGSKQEYLESRWVANEWSRYKYFIDTGFKPKNSLIIGYNSVFNPPTALGAVNLPKFDCDNMNALKQLAQLIQNAGVVANRSVIGEKKFDKAVVKRGDKPKNKVMSLFNIGEENTNKKAVSSNQIARTVIGSARANKVGVRITDQDEMLEAIYALIKDQAWDSAKDELNRLVAENPSCIKAYIYLLFIDNEVSTVDEFVQKSASFKHNVGEDGKTLFDYCMEYADKTQLKDADLCAEIYAKSFEYCLENGQYEPALKFYENVTKYDIPQAEACVLLLEEKLQKIVSIKPGNENARLMADAYMKSVGEENLDELLFVAGCLIKYSDFGDAQEFITKALELDPTSAEANFDKLLLEIKSNGHHMPAVAKEKVFENTRLDKKTPLAFENMVDKTQSFELINTIIQNGSKAEANAVIKAVFDRTGDLLAEGEDDDIPANEMFEAVIKPLLEEIKEILKFNFQNREKIKLLLFDGLLEYVIPNQEIKNYLLEFIEYFITSTDSQDINTHIDYNYRAGEYFRAQADYENAAKFYDKALEYFNGNTRVLLAMLLNKLEYAGRANELPAERLVNCLSQDASMLNDKSISTKKTYSLDKGVATLIEELLKWSNHYVDAPPEKDIDENYTHAADLKFDNIITFFTDVLMNGLATDRYYSDGKAKMFEADDAIKDLSKEKQDQNVEQGIGVTIVKNVLNWEDKAEKKYRKDHGLCETCGLTLNKKGLCPKCSKIDSPFICDKCGAGVDSAEVTKCPTCGANTKPKQNLEVKKAQAKTTSNSKTQSKATVKPISTTSSVEIETDDTYSSSLQVETDEKPKTTAKATVKPIVTSSVEIETDDSFSESLKVETSDDSESNK